MSRRAYERVCVCVNVLVCFGGFPTRRSGSCAARGDVEIAGVCGGVDRRGHMRGLSRTWCADVRLRVCRLRVWAWRWVCTNVGE